MVKDFEKGEIMVSIKKVTKKLIFVDGFLD
jgi:hypothetical protein